MRRRVYSPDVGSRPRAALRPCANTHRLVASSGRAIPGDDNPFDADLSPKHGTLDPCQGQTRRREEVAGVSKGDG